MSEPFTPEQEARVREIVATAIADDFAARQAAVAERLRRDAEEAVSYAK